MPKEISRAGVKIMYKEKINFDYQCNQAEFMESVMKTIVQQPDYCGIGGHGMQDHGNHGPHTQTSIGLGDKTINFRKLK